MFNPYPHPSRLSRLVFYIPWASSRMSLMAFWPALIQESASFMSVPQALARACTSPMGMLPQLSSWLSRPGSSPALSAA